MGRPSENSWVLHYWAISHLQLTTGLRLEDNLVVYTIYFNERLPLLSATIAPDTKSHNNVDRIHSNNEKTVLFLLQLRSV